MIYFRSPSILREGAGGWVKEKREKITNFMNLSCINDKLTGS